MNRCDACLSRAKECTLHLFFPSFSHRSVRRLPPRGGLSRARLDCEARRRGRVRPSCTKCSNTKCSRTNPKGAYVLPALSVVVLSVVVSVHLGLPLSATLRVSITTLSITTLRITTLSTLCRRVRRLPRLAARLLPRRVHLRRPRRAAGCL